MAERMTSVRPRSTADHLHTIGGLADHGRKTRPEMIEQFRRHWEHQQAQAETALALSDDDLIVETYTGVIVRKNCVEVTE